MIIRRLTTRHLPAVSEHFLRLPAEDICLRFIHPVSQEWIATQYVAKIDMDRDIALGAFEGDRIVGFCHVGAYPEHAFVELGLSIDVDFRKQGLGSRMLERAKVYAKLMGYTELRLSCARENRKMIALAKRHGIVFHGYDSEIDGAAPLQTVDAHVLTKAIWDEQLGGVQDLLVAAVLEPLHAFGRLSEGVAANNARLQRQIWNISQH